MLEIKGTYQTAYSMAETLDAETVKQIEAICSCEAYKIQNCKNKQSMEGIWSSCINKNTIDEAPMAYKNADAIKSAIGCTVNILEELKPIYNFKAN